MVALVAGNSLGLNLTSLATLGARGTAGNAGIGRGTDRAYVNVSNGNLVIQNRDDALASPGLWIDSLRTYNSQEHLGGDFRLPGLQPPRLTSTGGIGKSNSSVVRKDADGGEDLYTFDANRAAYLSTDGAGAYDTIRYINNQLVWTDGDTGLTEYYARYQNEWQLVLRQDSDGNAISFLYNKDGQVQSAINRSGEGVYYDYSNRLLAQVRTVTIDANGNAQTVRVRYGYDSFRRLASVTVDLSPENGSTADGRVFVTRYDYDGPSDRITAVRESDGSSLAITYIGAGNDTVDAAGRTVSHTDALGNIEFWTYDALGNKRSFRNALGAVWTYDVDAAGRVTREASPTVMLADLRTNPDGSLAIDAAQSGYAAVVTALRYDALGNLIERTEAQSRPEQRTTRYGYDALGRQVRTDFPEVGVYDAASDNLASNGRTGLAVRTERNAALYSETRYDALGNAVSGRDVGGAISYKTYDRLGRLEYEVDAHGQVTGHARNAFGDVTSLVRYAIAIDVPAAVTSDSIRAALRQTADDRSLQQEYDRAGRLVRTEQSAIDAFDSSAPDGQQTFHAGAVTTQRYNAFGEAIATAQLKNPLSNAWLVSRAWYDGNGRQIAMQDAAG